MTIGNKDVSVIAPNWGLYLGRPPMLIPPKGLKDCLNVRIQNQSLTRNNIGYGPFPDSSDADPINLDGNPVVMIDNFFPRAGGQFLMFATTKDMYLYIEADETVTYLTPRYEEGTADVTNGSATVAGTGTSWGSELKPGDMITFGAAEVVAQDAVWYEVLTVDSDTSLTLTADYDESTDTDIDYTARKTFTGELRDYWETDIFFAGSNLTVGEDGDRWYGTNGIDRPVAWDGNSSQVYNPDFGDVVACRAFAGAKNILMLINLTLDTGETRPFSVRTSAIGEPENMVTLEASEFVAHDGADPLTTAYAIGESIAIYGERSITLTQFVGPPTVFVFRNVMNGVGPRSGRAIADFGDFHRFIASDAQYDFDGIGIHEVNSHVWQEVIRQLSPQRLSLMSSHFDEERGDLIWIVPLNSDANTENGPPENAIVEHYLEDVGQEADGDPHTKRQIPATCWGFFERVTTLTFDQLATSWQDQNYRWNDQFFQGAFPFNVFGTNEGDVFVLGTKDSANGVPMKSYVRFGRRAIGNIRSKSLLQRIYPMVGTLPSAEHDLTVNVYTTDRPDGALTLEYTGDYSMKQLDNHFLSPRIMARYLELEFRTEGTGEIYSLIGYDIDAKGGGQR